MSRKDKRRLAGFEADFQHCFCPAFLLLSSDDFKLDKIYNLE